MKDYCIAVKKEDFKTKSRIERYLTDCGIDYTENELVISNYIRFRADKRTWKLVKKYLNLEVYTVYCKCK